MELESLLGCVSHDTLWCLPVVQPLLPKMGCNVTSQHSNVQCEIWAAWTMWAMEDQNLGLCTWMQRLILTQIFEINVNWKVERFCLFGPQFKKKPSFVLKQDFYYNYSFSFRKKHYQTILWHGDFIFDLLKLGTEKERKINKKTTIFPWEKENCILWETLVSL